MSFSPFSSFSHTNTESTHKTHFQIQDVNLLEFSTLKFVFVYMQYSRNPYSKVAFAITLLQWQRCLENLKHAQKAHWVAGGRLFAVFLCSNISFMQNITETPCVVHFALAWWADDRVVVFFCFIFQHWPVLLIIKPDYENILESWQALTNSNINKKIWQKGTQSTLPMFM